MFDWFKKKKPPRTIFEFEIGGVKHRLDPLVAWNALWFTEDIDLQNVWRSAQSGDHVSQKSLGDHLLDVFGLEPYDPDTGEGATILELHDLMWQLLAFMEDLKKKRGHSRTTSRTSDTKSSVKPTTQPESESSSTENASGKDART